MYKCNPGKITYFTDSLPSNLKAFIKTFNSLYIFHPKPKQSKNNMLSQILLPKLFTSSAGGMSTLALAPLAD